VDERHFVRIRGLLGPLLRLTSGEVRRALPPGNEHRAAPQTGGYGMAIVLIVATYALAVTADERWKVPVLLLVQVVTVWYALRASRARPGLRIGAAGVFVLALGAGVADLLDRSGGLAGYTFLAASVLYLVAPVSITADLARRRDVGRQLMLGALATFLMIGMAFAFGYRCLAALEPGPFFGDAGDGTLADSLFFSFITLTSTGYGDLVPAGVTGQSMAVLEALLGQLFLVIAVSKIVNVWKPRGW
jgi:hypothetical protein